MKRMAPLLMAAVLLLVIPSLSSGQEEAKYNFASAQANKQIKVAPGGEGEGVIYFYNIEGNRITHITLEVSKTPANWKVEIDPPPHEIQANVSGRIVTITENLHVEPSQVLSQEPKEVPEGMVGIKIANLGYALAKAVRITVQVPESVAIGTKGDILIAAEAEWLGQTGAAAIKQAREFEFFVEVVSGQTEFSETIIGEVEKPEAMETPTLPAPPTPPAPTPAPSGIPIMDWLPAIIGGVVVILGIVLILVLVAKKRR